MYELRDVNDKLIKEITYKEMMEKLNNHEAGHIKENKRIVGCRLYEPIKTIEIEQEEQQEEVIKDNIEIAENNTSETWEAIRAVMIGTPLLLSFFLILIFIKEIYYLLTGLLIFAIPSFLSLMGSAARYCAVREVYDTYKGKK